jgi:hypothetical protein
VEAGADDDIFFPAESSIEKCKNKFANFQAYHLLKNTTLSTPGKVCRNK